MRVKLLVILLALAATSCSSGDPAIPIPPSVIDLHDPCATVTTAEVSEAVGITMLRSSSGAEDADRIRSCRWVATAADTDPASIDYLDVAPRPFVDVVLRQTGIDDTYGVEEVFAEIEAASNSRRVDVLVATPEKPGLADDVLRTDTGLWARKGSKMLIILADDPVRLEAMMGELAELLLKRL